MIMLFTKFEKHIKVIKGAIHVGGHEGQERDWYRKLGFSPVIWFEPNKTLFQRLKRNLRGYVNQEAFNIGVHDTLEEAPLHISNNNGQSSSLLELGLHTVHHPKVKYIRDEVVPLTRIDTFFEDGNLDIKDYNLLNVDVQGVELNVIKSFGDLIGELDYVYAEVNEAEVYKECALVTEIDAYLEKYGFCRKVTYMTKCQWGDAFYIKKSLL